MTPASIPALSETATALCVILIFLIPCAGAGIALINTGLARSRSAAHLMMSSLCVFSIAALIYFIWGFAWQGFIGGPAHVLMVGGKGWDWIAAEPFFLRGVALDGSPASLAALFGMLSVGLAALIPLGSWSRPLAPRCLLRLDRSSGRLDVPSVRTLGVGRRMAGAAGHKLRAWPGFRGYGRSQHGSSSRWHHRARRRLDFGRSPG